MKKIGTVVLLVAGILFLTNMAFAMCGAKSAQANPNAKAGCQCATCACGCACCK